MRSEEEVEVGVAVGLGVLVGALVITVMPLLGRVVGAVVLLFSEGPQPAFQSTVAVAFAPMLPLSMPAVFCGGVVGAAVVGADHWSRPSCSANRW